VLGLKKKNPRRRQIHKLQRAFPGQWLRVVHHFQERFVEGRVRIIQSYINQASVLPALLRPGTRIVAPFRIPLGPLTS